jgi:uncharacterized repeat protein (TIGR03803 family)
MPAITFVRYFPALNLEGENSATDPNRAHSRNSSVLMRLAALCLFCLAAAVASAQTFKVLDPNGGSDQPLIQGLDGNLYGVINGVSGTYGNGGAVVKVTPTGKVSTLYNFCSQPNCSDGVSPSGLVLGTDGNFYGVTLEGGGNSNIDCDGEQVGSCGTVFRLTPSGKFTTIYNFCALANCADGSLPNSVLVQGTDGNFYGTTWYGGLASTCYGDIEKPTGCGTVFKITPKGVLTTLYEFCSTDSCTSDPSGVVLAKNGVFYGLTNFGGTGTGGPQCGNGCGVFYSLTSAGVFTTLYSFCIATNCPDGAHPQGELVLASNGNFYGVADDGGANNFGTVFKIAPGGTLVTLYSFCAQANCPDGAFPDAGLIQATDGNFYGTTSSYGATGTGGTLFRISPGGKLKTLYSFCSQTDCNDGADPLAALFQATNGTLYGTAYSGGATSFGTIFRLITTGLAPFVETIPTIGKVGAAVRILGNSLTGATAVNFNGTPATFTVVSATEITTTVPTGATSGKLTVTTSGGGTLTSNVSFQVK